MPCTQMSVEIRKQLVGWFSLSTMWIWRTEPKSSDLAASTFIHWTVLSAPNQHFWFDFLAWSLLDNKLPLLLSDLGSLRILGLGRKSGHTTSSSCLSANTVSVFPWGGGLWVILTKAICYVQYEKVISPKFTVMSLAHTHISITQKCAE